MTSYTQLAPRLCKLVRSAGTCSTPTSETPRKSYFEQAMTEGIGPVQNRRQRLRAGVARTIAAVRAQPKVDHVLGTDGMGRSETREALRRHFEVDAECDRDRGAAPAASNTVQVKAETVAKAIQDLGFDPEKNSCGVTDTCQYRRHGRNRELATPSATNGS